MKIITAKERRAVKEVRLRTSTYNCSDNLNQLPSVMQARAKQQTRRLEILADAGLDDNKTMRGEKAQLAYMAKCEAAIEAAERLM